MLTKLIFGILGVVILTAVFEIIMPDGAFRRYVKFAVSAIFVLIVLTSVDFRNIGGTDFLWGESVEIEQDVLESVQDLRVRELERSVQRELARKGFGGVGVTVRMQSDGEISEVRLNLSDLVLTGEEPNINITMEIRNTVADFLGLEDEKVIADEVERQ